MPTPQPSADMNLRLLRHLVAYVRDHYDTGSLKHLAAAGGLDLDTLVAGTGWVSLEAFEAVLASARAMFGDDQTFKRACAYKVADIPGPLRFCMGALSPLAGYQLGADNMRLVSTISRFKPELCGHGRVRVRYETTKRESHLVCLTRQAQIEQLPTLWGMPPAHLTESTCVARGDDACTYDVHVYEPRRWLPAALGALLGAAAYFAWVFAAGAAHPQQRGAWLASAFVGFLLGQIYEYRRTSVSNRHVHDAINSAYVQAARDEANARRELFALMQRQTSWGQMMETEVVERAQRLHDVAGALEQLQSSAIVPLRGPSNAAQSPLESVQATLQSLRARLKADAQVVAALDRLDADLETLGRRLKELGRTAASSRDLIELVPETLETWPLVHELRTRLRALVHLPDVRVSVFAAREAPERIRTDIALFNRIVDNLLVNAASQTKRGSIVAEISGTPGFLTLKISDTGPGIEEQALVRLFRPLQRTAIGPAAAAGLSVVVQLLALVGGKLEVMSNEGRGSTFWAHIPVDSDAIPEQPASAPSSAGSELESALREVVSIRRSSQG